MIIISSIALLYHLAVYKYNNDLTDTSIIIQPETNSLTTAWLLQ